MTTDSAHLCPGCFADTAGTNPCPHCGFDDRAPRPMQALPLRTVLNGQFLVGRVLGKPGGFGITYLAWDQMLQATVAIKEYLPRELAVRAQDSRTLHPHSHEETDLFRYGLEQFLNEARTLAQLDHPNLVRVRQFFEANGTAYLVMDYYRGCSLAEHLETQPNSRMSESDALALMQPILDGLRAVHAKGFLHRDIKPQNIYLAATDSGGVRPILLDFGAARQSIGEHSRSLSVVISPGYAPFEQYHRKGQQGPATDIYGAAAVLYRMLTGVVPPEATERMAGEELRPAAEFGVSPQATVALTEALAMKMDARPVSIEAFQQVLQPSVARGEDKPPAVPSGSTVRPEVGHPSRSAPPRPSEQQQQGRSDDLRAKEKAHTAFNTPMWIISLVGVFVTMATIIPWFSSSMPEQRSQNSSPLPPEQPYHNHGDGTLTDLSTDLQWMRCSLGQKWTGATCAGSADEMTWDSIMPNGEQKTWPKFAGFSDWRVPTIDELKTLIYCSSGQPDYWKVTNSFCQGGFGSPTIASEAFPNTPSIWFWSASPYANGSDSAWGVDFYYGSVNDGIKGNYRAVRLVRGGQ